MARSISAAGLPQVWDGPHGPVPVVRADGRPLYAYHDLVFAKEVAPTYYVTGQEQREHFKALGLEKHHLPMGLVLGPDGKKLKSRDGTALPAVEAIGLVEANLNDTANKTKLAWNILAWNFLHVTRPQDVKFEVEKWTRPEAPGMHITYTHARIAKASGSGDLVADLYMKGLKASGSRMPPNSTSSCSGWPRNTATTSTRPPRRWTRPRLRTTPMILPGN